MTDERFGSVPAVEHGDQWLTAVASVAVGAAFFGLWFWLLPQWLGFRIETAGTANWRWLATLPSVLGFAVALRCVWDFGRTGRGTPAPVAPPQRLVVVGFYRYVRNPMYLGFAAGWIGLWIVFGHSNPAVIAAAVAVALAYICSFSFMKSRLCAANSEQTTKSIAGTRIDGGRVSEAGTSRSSDEPGKGGQMNILLGAR